MDNRVVITGIGLVSSIGLSATETWNNLLSGKSGIRSISKSERLSFENYVAAMVHGMDSTALNIHPRDARIMDKHSYMLMKSSRESFNQSAIDLNSVSPQDIGYFAGMGMIDYNIDDLLPAVLESLSSNDNLNYNKFFSHGHQEIHPLWPLSMLNNISFCQVAIDLNIRGDNAVFSPHADSGMHAVIEAYNAIIERRAKVALAGGVSEKISPSSMARASIFGILNTTSKEKESGCRPFSKNRRGTVLGEGCGIITLELKSSADNRQVPSMAMIAGYGTSFESNKEAKCPTARAITLAMENALARSALKPSQIDLIIAHGDGTIMGDANEAEAIQQTFAECINSINVYSSKSALGHMLAGSPAVDIILGISILKNAIIPPVINSLPLQDDIMFNLVCKEPIKADPKRILINSGSYEGQCASLIIEAID